MEANSAELTSLQLSEDLLLSLLDTSASVAELLSTMDPAAGPQLDAQCNAFAETVQQIDTLWSAPSPPSSSSARAASTAAAAAPPRENVFLAEQRELSAAATARAFAEAE